jgi:hypothetical protein
MEGFELVFDRGEVGADPIGLAQRQPALGIVAEWTFGAHVAGYGLPQPPVGPRQSA